MAVSTHRFAWSADDSSQRIERAEKQMRGKTLQARATLRIESGGPARELAFRAWTQGNDRAVVKILNPPKDRDTGNLRLEMNLWQYLPNIERIVKIPSSLMLQSWMGSDFSNDDLVKTSSLARDYKHSTVGKEKLGDHAAVKILCEPRPDAPVVWGKVHVWLRASDSVPLKQEFYSETGELLKVLETLEIKTYGDHTVPNQLSMTTVKKKSKTTLVYQEMVFDQAISPSVFTQEFLRKPAPK
ncbi:MAG: outer membrane lipoprotein-sorting protein [Bacteriovoracia bacterium]